MRSIVQIAALVALAWCGIGGAQPIPKDDKKDAKPTAAAELTRTKLLKVKVSIDAKGGRLGDVLKEFAAQVDMKAEVLILWQYGSDFPYAQKVTYACKDKPLDAALDELLTKAGGGLGYIVVSKEGDKRDGWVSLNTTGERGSELPDATAEEETAAADRLAIAKKLIDAGKPDSAKPVLTLVVTKYPTTKAAVEAKQLLEKIGK